MPVRVRTIITKRVHGKREEKQDAGLPEDFAHQIMLRIQR